MSGHLSKLYSNRSATFIHLQKYEEALEDAEKAIQLDPSWATGYSRKGFAACHLRRYDEAIQSFQECQLRDTENRYAISELQVATFGKKYQQNILKFQENFTRATLCTIKNTVQFNLGVMESAEFANKSTSMTMKLKDGVKCIHTVILDVNAKIVGQNVPKLKEMLITNEEEMKIYKDLKNGQTNLVYISIVFTKKEGVAVEGLCYWREWNNQSDNEKISRPLSKKQAAILDITCQEASQSSNWQQILSILKL
eukprot:TRINITY_DN6617_c0_g1_i3.p1 TRINITY_DN6617_c0_g1~~TRINITY_DN6617_c0_g1_i3.p1  ORF type:complete len:296 (-),score=90.52 TRINITY_DN6617_c0_g1_i3:4-762(-)